jgi:hypothetical protein
MQNAEAEREDEAVAYREAWHLARKRHSRSAALDPIIHDLTGEHCVICNTLSSTWMKGDNCDHHACGNCFDQLFYGTNVCPACPSQLVIFSKKERTPDKIQHPLECMYCFDTLTENGTVKGNAEGCGHLMCRNCFDKYVTNGESNYCMFCNPERLENGPRFWTTSPADGTQCPVCLLEITGRSTRTGDNCAHVFCNDDCYDRLVGTTNRCPLCDKKLTNGQPTHRLRFT